MAEFTELMKHEPNKAYDFISNNYTNYWRYGQSEI
jgi:hypothetical protein